MRISIVASLLVLAAGAGLGWRDWQQIAILQTTRRDLAGEEAKLGAPPESALISGRSTKRKRPTPAVGAELSTASLVGLSMEILSLNSAGGLQFHAINALHLRILDSLSAMDAAGLESFLAETCTNPDLDPRIRQLLAASCTTVLANDHPQAALAIFIGSPELFTDGDRGRSLVITALACWARKDPAAALDWEKNHSPKEWDAKPEIISAVAEQDARLAFRLISSPDFKAIGNIIDSAQTLDEKSAALAGLRVHLATIQDEKIRARVSKLSLGGLASRIDRESCERATRWISESNFTPQELRHFIDRLHFPTKANEPGGWIDWIRQSLPASEADPIIENLILEWAAGDYEAAARWAMVRPPNEDRALILKTIHAKWPGQDPAGKAAFAARHGIR